MSDKTPPRMECHVIKSNTRWTDPLKKADTPTNLSEADRKWGPEWIEPEYDLVGLKTLVKESSILPQCIRAYKSNIAGFGIGIRYKEDMEETPEMMAEYTKIQEVIELLTMDEDTKEVFEHLREAQETYGIAYLEAIRNADKQVDQIDFIVDTPTMRKSRRVGDMVMVDYHYKDRIVKRNRRFCKYRQKVGGKTVYFKEFGDPRVMDRNTGEYTNEKLKPEDQANEILEFAIGPEPYGEVRWIGQVLGVDGSRKAETLNNRYFEEGRHTPLLILIRGGRLKDESFAKLQGYMDDIKGEKGQHAFLLMELESDESRTDFDMAKQPEVQVIPLANVLQKDELFQDYLDNNRRKVQSSFLLPDIYVGYTTDFNRATAQAAMEVTESQVFIPERNALTWMLNHKLLVDYQFKYVEAYFKAPNISNPEDQARILTIAEKAGGIPPNKAKEIAFAALGEVAEPYEGDWANVPLAYSRSTYASSPSLLEQYNSQLAKQIQKAQSANDDAVVAVMKEVRELLVGIHCNDE